MKRARKRTILLTGCGGFLGRAICRHAPKQFNLICTDISLEAPDGFKSAYRQLDIHNVDEKDFTGVDVVIHNAGLFDLKADLKALMAVNAYGSQKVATAAKNAGVGQFIQVSSTSIYGAHPLPIRETADPKKPVHDYGKSKWSGEVESKQNFSGEGRIWCALRPTLIYGPHSRYGMAPFLAFLDHFSQEGKHLFLPAGGPLSHMVHVDDVARAVWYAVEHQAEGEFNVADDTPQPFGQLLAALGDFVGLNYTLVPTPWRFFRPLLSRPHLIAPLMRGLGRKLNSRTTLGQEISMTLDEDWCEFLVNDHVFDTRSLKAIGFEFSYPDTLVGIRNTINWYRENGWLPETRKTA